MFFAGLIGAYVVFRFGSPVWPSGHLYLPVGITWVNTAFLLFSCYTMWRAMRCIQADQQQPFVRWLAVTALLGSIFLGVQGFEWVQRGPRRAHHFSRHVWRNLLYADRLSRPARACRGSVARHRAGAGQTRGNSLGSTISVVEICSMYWYYVGAVWVVLFPLVYLN